jgi:hypothetical protein
MPSNYWMTGDNELRVKGSGRCPVEFTTSVSSRSDEGHVACRGMWKIQWALLKRYLPSCQTPRYGKSGNKSKVKLEKMLARHLNLYHHTDRRRRVMANTRMGKFAIRRVRLFVNCVKANSR